MNDAVIISIVGGLLGGSAVAAIVNAIAEGVRQRRKRRYDKDDGKDKDTAAPSVILTEQYYHPSS